MASGSLSVSSHAANPSVTWKKKDIFTKLWPSKLLSDVEKKDIQIKVQAVANYCFSQKLFLRGSPADGNCFFHSILKSYEEKEIKISLLDREQKKIRYLRGIISDYIIERNPKRSTTIRENLSWISSDEGALLAPSLNVVLRVITINKEKTNTGIEDVVYKGNGCQQWKQLKDKEKPLLKETLIVVDLGGHFIWASSKPHAEEFEEDMEFLKILNLKTKETEKSPLKQLPTSNITLWSNGQPSNFPLDGTEENFIEVLKEIAKLNKHVLHTSKSPSKDDAYDSDKDFSEKQSDEHFLIWKNDAPPPAAKTTVTCNDRNVKGNEILTQCHSYISKFVHAVRAEFSEKHSEEKLTQCAVRFPGKYYAICAGRFAKIKTSLDSQQTFSPGIYILGLSKVKLQLNDQERLVIIDEELKEWITKDLGLKVKRWDLPYRGYEDVIGIQEIIEAIKENVYSYSAINPNNTEPRKVPDNELGTVQLYCAFPESYPIGNGPNAKLLRQGALHKFLDFFNALIFGVEASRNNLVFLTGVLALLDMRYGSFPTKEGQTGHFLYDDLLDIFPMAVTGTGSGNFVAEKAMYIATEQLKKNFDLLDGRHALGF